MNGQQIGIKLADGSFYPVLSEDDRIRKKLVLTTVRDNQESVQIDLYRGEGEIAAETEYIGTLMIENIQPAAMREPEVEVVLGVDVDGNLEATASDAITGESQSLSVSLESLATGPVGSTEFELEREAGDRDDFEESLLAGEQHPSTSADRGKTQPKREKRRSPLLIVGLVILSLILIAGITFLVFRALGGTPIPALLAGREVVSARQPGEAEQTETTQTEQPAAEAAETEAAQESSPSAASEAGVWYQVKWGDTLWDIAGTYYRNPWLYPKIARENRISNPDLIFAGTRIFIPEN